MKKQWAAMVCILTVSLYMVPATADEYSNAYDCGIEALRLCQVVRTVH